MRLWYDDIRRPPDDTWVWARTNGAAMQRLLDEPCEEISFDHDMGLHHHDPDEVDADLRVAEDAWRYEDGAELARWMVKREIVPPTVRIHSFNPVGARNIAQIMLDGATVLGVPCHITIKPFHPNERTAA